ncbi:hypothetical protein GQ600_25241 [Phytophthora cactorum]|nr:hypothetical protein GQ600_25241 [Phytophthora cactorum]
MHQVVAYTVTSWEECRTRRFNVHKVSTSNQIRRLQRYIDSHPLDDDRTERIFLTGSNHGTQDSGAVDVVDVRSLDTHIVQCRAHNAEHEVVEISDERPDTHDYGQIFRD